MLMVRLHCLSTILIVALFVIVVQSLDIGYKCGSLRCAAEAECKTFWFHAAQCKCKPGFEGDGEICTDIDECMRGTHLCSPHAKCINTPGSHRCVCLPGFSGTGIECEDINECEGVHHCEDHLICENRPGHYVCKVPISKQTYLYYGIVGTVLFFILLVNMIRRGKENNDQFTDLVSQIVNVIMKKPVKKSFSIEKIDDDDDDDDDTEEYDSYDDNTDDDDIEDDDDTVDEESEKDYQYFTSFVSNNLAALANILQQRFTLISFSFFAYFYFLWKEFVIGEMLDRIPFWHSRVIWLSKNFGNHTLWILLAVTNVIYYYLSDYLFLSPAKLDVFSIILEGIISEFNRHRVMYKLFECREQLSKWKMVLEAVFMEIIPITLLHDLLKEQFSITNLAMNYKVWCLFVLLLLLIPTKRPKFTSSSHCNAIKWCIELSNDRFLKFMLGLTELLCIFVSCMYFVVGVFFVST